jgi:hypothetical protein
MKEAFDAEAEQTITRMVRNARAEARTHNDQRRNDCHRPGYLRQTMPGS